jgi:hypothetical protein
MRGYKVSRGGPGVADGGKEGLLHIIMVLPAQVNRVDVHAAVVGPVVGKSNNKLDADVGGGGDYSVEGINVDDRRAVGGPPLEDYFGIACAFVAILWQSVRVIGHVFVVKLPGAENSKPGSLGGSEAALDIGLVL